MTTILNCANVLQTAARPRRRNNSGRFGGLSGEADGRSVASRGDYGLTARLIFDPHSIRHFLRLKKVVLRPGRDFSHHVPNQIVETAAHVSIGAGVGQGGPAECLCVSIGE